MKVVIDTSSLLSLVRYYLHFDKSSVLFNFIKNKIKIGEIIVIDKVHKECSYFSSGLILKTLPFLTDKIFLKSAKLPIKTDSLIAPKPSKFSRMVDNSFVNTTVRNSRKLTEAEYESQKNVFMNDADMRLILLCLKLIKDNQDEDIILVTEESETGNDNKLFIKIPAICKHLNIVTMTLPQLIEKYDGIDLEFK